MAFTVTVLWRCALALLLITVIAASACARAPRGRVAQAELGRLVACAIVLYGVGGLAAVTHHAVLAVLVSGAGIGVAALAAWMSRGRGGEHPPDGQEPHDEQPPPAPDGAPRLDWASFERAFRDYARRSGAEDRRRVPGRRQTTRSR